MFRHHRMELTEEHKKWVDEIESSNKDLPAGFARGLVQLYLSNPAFFSKENIDAMKNAKKPDGPPMKEGSITVLPPPAKDSEIIHDSNTLSECSDTTCQQNEQPM